MCVCVREREKQQRDYTRQNGEHPEMHRVQTGFINDATASRSGYGRCRFAERHPGAVEFQADNREGSIWAAGWMGGKRKQ